MEQYIMKGGNPLVGEVTISGAKNAALGILAAAIMTDDDVVIDNLPDVSDINALLEAISHLGAKVERIDRHTVKINAENIHAVTVEDEHMRKIRASYYFIGALLGKYKSAEVPLPGGCTIGSRPIDQHLKGFRALGSDVKIVRGAVVAHAIDLVASHIYLDVVSVGATINIMMAATMAEGETIKKADLQAWVDFANKNGAVIIYDAAYEAYITEAGIPHSIYECEGAKTCAIELRSFSKKAGFTGMRLGFAVIPKDLKSGDVSLNAMWMRRQGSKYNGTPYIIQRAGEAVYSPEGKAQVAGQIARYMKNAKTIYTGLKDAGFTVYGGVNSPYIWLKTPNDMKSWDFFDYLLNNAGIVGTPGAGFGPSGEGYFRITAFGTYENSLKALDRIKNL